MPGSGPLTTVEGSPWHPQRSARRRHADLRCERLDGHQQSFPCSRLNPSSPATFPLDVQDRMGGVQLLLQPSHFRLELVHLRAEGVALGGLPTAFARGQALKRPLTPRPAPFRQMGAVQTLAAKQPAHLAGLRAALCLLQNPQSILRGELAPLRLGHDLRVRRWPRVAGSGPGGLVATLLDPQGRSAHLLQCHRFSLCGHWYSPPPPYSNSKGAGVSVMLAERGGSARFDTFAASVGAAGAQRFEVRRRGSRWSLRSAQPCSHRQMAIGARRSCHGVSGCSSRGDACRGRQGSLFRDTANR